jgi:hypothetical protein
VLFTPFIEYGAQSIIITEQLNCSYNKNVYIRGLGLPISPLLTSKEAPTYQTPPPSATPTMKTDSLARRAILFVTFIIATTVVYGITTRFLFTAPQYDDVSIDPEGGSYYDYGSRVAAAVWKGAGHWIGMAEAGSVNGTVASDGGLEDKGQNSTRSDALDPESTFVAIALPERVSRRQRLRSRRVHLQPEHCRYWSFTYYICYEST